MKIVCSSTLACAREAFCGLGDVTVLEDRRISARDVREADALIVRSTTPVTRALLEQSRVRFAGTATIGTDHMDLPFLEQRGIRWCHAPGCNASSVSEYFTAALLCLAARNGFALRGRTVGVIGAGAVGTRVARKAELLGMRVLLNDPPRQRAEAPAGSRFVPLDALLRHADVVTLHVPLTSEGEDRTLHLADESFFARLKPGAIFFNAARGAVVRTDDLLAALATGRVKHAVIDTWEGEPAYRKDLLARVDLGTPHIAGHSLEGKVRGTHQVYLEACRFFGVPPAWSPEPLLQRPNGPAAPVPPAPADEVETLWKAVRAAYDIEADDRRLREGCVDDPARRAEHFDSLRRNYPERREFPAFRVDPAAPDSPARDILRQLGFV
jgi:erythronate-4-phosphate dehydrogenase